MQRHQLQDWCHQLRLQVGNIGTFKLDEHAASGVFSRSFVRLNLVLSVCREWRWGWQLLLRALDRISGRGPLRVPGVDLDSPTFRRCTLNGTRRGILPTKTLKELFNESLD
jgi:hypothetical protein